MELLAALCLVLVVEGLMPFLAPKAWRETVTKVAQFTDGQLRMIGLICIVLGLVSYGLMSGFTSS
jgi:uncharacterized protein YjeT (DUF2065 family)